MGFVDKDKIKLYMNKKKEFYLTYGFTNKHGDKDIMYIQIPDWVNIDKAKGKYLNPTNQTLLER